jgi:hypothetical protein
MIKPYHVDVWPGQTDSQGKAVKWTYVAMADSPVAAHALVTEALPSDWKFNVPDDWPPYGPIIVMDFDLKPGEVRRIG